MFRFYAEFDRSIMNKVPVKIGLKHRASDYCQIVMKRFLKGAETVTIQGRRRLIHKKVLTVGLLVIVTL